MGCWIGNKWRLIIGCSVIEFAGHQLHHIAGITAFVA